MVRITAAVRAFVVFVLLVSTTGGGWMAACVRPAAATVHPSHDASSHAMHGGMHHHAPVHHRPAAPEPGPQPPDCPVLAMNGGGCTAAADAATLVLSLPRTLVATDAYPSAAGVHDRLLSDAFFRPPRVRSVAS